MKVECENLSEREATPELIRELIRDDARRGEFMILMQDADEEAFVQIAGDYDDVGGVNDGCFDLEYRDGESSLLYHADRRATADEVEQAFLSELRGDRSWRSRFEWETEKVGGGGVGIDSAIRAFFEGGRDRQIRSVELPAEGRRLRPKLPTGVVFLFIWCLGWNGGVLFGLGPQALSACRAFAEKGFQGVLVV